MSKLHNLSTKLRQQVLESLKLFFDFKIISGYALELLKTYCFHSEHIFFIVWWWVVSDTAWNVALSALMHRLSSMCKCLYYYQLFFYVHCVNVCQFSALYHQWNENFLACTWNWKLAVGCKGGERWRSSQLEFLVWSWSLCWRPSAKVTSIDGAIDFKRAGSRVHNDRETCI